MMSLSPIVKLRLPFGLLDQCPPPSSTNNRRVAGPYAEQYSPRKQPVSNFPFTDRGVRMHTDLWAHVSYKASTEF